MYKPIVHEPRGDGLVRGGGSILTTTHLARFRQYVFEAAVAEQIQGGGAAENRMGLLQPAGLGQVGDLQGLQHLGQSVDHTIGAIGVELPEGEAPFSLIQDPQQGAGLESVVHRLAAAGGEELVHLGCTDSAGQELEAEGKAAPECFEHELGGIGGGGLTANRRAGRLPWRWGRLPAGPQRTAPAAVPPGLEDRAAHGEAGREQRPETQLVG